MTDNEINIAIGEWMGWETAECKPGFGRPNFGPGIGFGDEEEPLPSYTTDLNAIHLAEEKLMKGCGVWFEWFDHLAKVTNESIPVRATARQRAESLLRTIGKWRGE